MKEAELKNGVNLEYKIFKPNQFKIKADEEGIIEAYVSIFGNVDLMNEVVEPGAFKKSLERKLPKGVWMHNWEKPIAKTLEAKEDSHGLYIKGQMIMEVQQAKEAYALLKEGVVDEFSIGYQVDKDAIDENGVRHLKELTLYEWSPVLVGANQETQLLGIKGVLPYHECPKAPEDEEWDAGEEVKKAEVEDLKQMCAWYDEDHADVKSSYKLPHHKCNSSYTVVWKGVAAAMEALMGARGGVGIPDADWDGVYNHLAKHYQDFDKEPPEKEQKPEPDISDNYIRIRVKDPGDFDPDSFRTIDISEEEGIKAVIGCPKGEYEGGKCNVGTETQSYLFLKDKWTVDEAEAWVEENGKGAKEGRILSEKNRALIGETISQLEQLSKQIKQTIYPLKDLLSATEAEKSEGGKVGADSKKVLRIRDAAKQMDKAAEFILRITK
jgi:hypothetical protein